jgi:hypothetical protein
MVNILVGYSNLGPMLEVKEFTTQTFLRTTKRSTVLHC